MCFSVQVEEGRAQDSAAYEVSPEQSSHGLEALRRRRRSYSHDEHSAQVKDEPGEIAETDSEGKHCCIKLHNK